MNCPMQKGNKGKLRTGTVNKATYDWPWRAAKKPEC